MTSQVRVKIENFDFSGLVTSASKIYMLSANKAILGSKFKKIIFRKNDHFSLGYFMTPMTPFRHIRMANGCQIQNQRTKLPLGAQKSETWHMTSSKVIDLWWPRLTSERSQCQCQPWMIFTYPIPLNLSTPIHVHQHKCRSSQVFRRWNGTERKFRLTWPWKLGYKSGHIRYGLKIFREGVKLFNV